MALAHRYDYITIYSNSMMSIPSSLLYYAYISSSGSRLSTALHMFVETLKYTSIQQYNVPISKFA
jgi:hypothetical protein